MGASDNLTSLLDEAIRLAKPYECLRALTEEMTRLKARANQPLRVAVVGLIKAGKSTLMNALIGEKVLITGFTETTYTVSWFKYGDRPSLRVVFRNREKPPVVCDGFDKLAFWTSREYYAQNPEMNEVGYIEIYYPHPLFKVIELVDTPGLGSKYKTDAQNSADFIGIATNRLNAEELEKLEQQATDDTVIATKEADAVIYAFSRGAQESDREVLEAFQNKSLTNTSPINAFGLFTQADLMCKVTEQDPLEGVAEVVNQYRNHPDLKNLLFTIFPLCACAAENCGKISEEDWQIIKRLSQIPDGIIFSMMSSVDWFLKENLSEFVGPEITPEQLNEIDVSPEDRAQVFYNMGYIYGVYMAVKAVRSGITPEQYPAWIHVKCGMENVMNLIKQHFGNRANLIRFLDAISQLRQLCYPYVKGNKTGDTAAIKICEHIMEQCGMLEGNEHSFKELIALQYYYNGAVKLNEREAKELRELVGEFGHDCESRLGVPRGTAIEELAKIAREKAVKWNTMAYYPGKDKKYQEVSGILARSCENIYFHLEYLLGVR